MFLLKDDLGTCILDETANEKRKKRKIQKIEKIEKMLHNWKITVFLQSGYLHKQNKHTYSSFLDSNLAKFLVPSAHEKPLYVMFSTAATTSSREPLTWLVVSLSLKVTEPSAMVS